MELLISKLLDDFDQGRMTRRQLIKSLTVVAAAAAGTTPAFAETAKGFKAIAVNHISYQVNDYAKTRDFYADLLGMKPVADTGKQCNLILGDTNTFVIPRNAPQGVTPPRIDHVCLHHRKLGQKRREGRARSSRSQSAARHREQLPRKRPKRLRSIDLRQRHEAHLAGILES